MRLQHHGTLALCAIATGCATTTELAPAGLYQTDAAIAVTLARDWSAVPGRYSPTGVPILTLDGTRLNQVHIITDIDAGAGIIKSTGDESAGPVFRPGITELELADFLTGSIAAFGYQDVVSDLVTPDSVAGAEGVRVDFSATKPSGLRMKGVAIAAETGGALDVLLFVAPEVHYYSASIQDVELMFDSAVRN